MRLSVDETELGEVTEAELEARLPEGGQKSVEKRHHPASIEMIEAGSLMRWG